MIPMQSTEQSVGIILHYIHLFDILSDEKGANMAAILGNAVAIACICILVFFCGRNVYRDFKAELSGAGCSGCGGSCAGCSKCSSSREPCKLKNR